MFEIRNAECFYIFKKGISSLNMWLRMFLYFHKNENPFDSFVIEIKAIE